MVSQILGTMIILSVIAIAPALAKEKWDSQQEGASDPSLKTKLKTMPFSGGDAKTSDAMFPKEQVTPKGGGKGTMTEATATQTSIGDAQLSQQMSLSVDILLFFGIVLALEIMVMFRQGAGWGPETTKIVGLTLILGSGLFLITAGYSQDQIAGIVGLLGTIAGYLLGQSGRAGSQATTSTPNTPGTQ